MKKIIYIALILSGHISYAQINYFSVNSGIAAVDTNVAVKNLLIAFTGESNSGGFALNSTATSLEVAQTSDVYIYDNVNHNHFDSLKISDPNSNNLLGHRGLEPYVGERHGWELELINLVRDGTLDYYDQVYIVKTGQGGSTTNGWLNNSYNGWAIYDTLLKRVDTAMAIMDTLSLPYDFIFFSSFGINNAISETDSSTFYDSCVVFYNRLRSDIGLFDIIGTEIMINDNYYDSINNALKAMNTNISYFHTVSVDGAQYSGDHWTYLGMKLICDRMVAKMKEIFNVP